MIIIIKFMISYETLMHPHRPTLTAPDDAALQPRRRPLGVKLQDIAVQPPVVVPVRTVQEAVAAGDL